MKHIKFRYRDAMSHWEWREQECDFPTVREAIEWYGLGVNCQYQIISVEEAA